MKKLNLMEKIDAWKKKRLEKKILSIEEQVQLIKKIDNSLSNVSLANLSIQCDTDDPHIVKKINRIEKKLLKLKTAYEDQIQEQSSEAIALKEIEEAFTKVSYSNDHFAIEPTDKILEQYIAKIDLQLVSIQNQSSTRDSFNLLINQIQFYLSHIADDEQLIDLKVADQSIEMQVLKIKKYLLSIKEIYQAKSDEVNAKKQLEKFHSTYEKEVYRVKVKIARLNHQIKVLKDNLWWIQLSKEDKKDWRSDLSFYIPNTLGYWLTLLSVAAEIVYLILLLSVMVRNYWVGICILVNIAFLLLLFTIAIKVKNYKKTFSFVSIGFGIYCILRIAYIIHGLMKVDLSTVPTIKLIFIYGANAYMILISILVGIHSYFKIKHQMLYLSENKITKFQLSK